MPGIMLKCKELFQRRKFLLILIAVLTIEICYIIWFNFTKLPYALDQDSAKGMVHIAEMVKTGSVFIKNWYYVSTVELDTAGLLAIPFYMITGNIWTSFAFSNCIFTVVMLLVLLWLTGEMQLKTETRVFILCLVFMPWQYGMLEYFNMLFINFGQYSQKVLIPLMGIALLNDRKAEDCNETAGKVSKWFIASRMMVTLVFLALVYISALSSGIFILVVGLLPLYVVFELQIMAGGKVNFKTQLPKLVLLALSLVLSVMGIVICRLNGVVPEGVDASLTAVDEAGTMLSEGFERLLYLLNGLPDGDGVAVLSLDGVGYLIRFMIVCLLIIALIVTAVSRARKALAGRAATSEAGICAGGAEAGFTTDAGESITDYLLMIFFFNAVIHMLSSFESYRYCLIEIVPMMILLGALLEKWSVVLRTRVMCNMVKILSAGVMGVLLLTTITNVNDMMDESRALYSRGNALLAFFYEYGTDNVIFLDESRLEEICRLVDTDTGSMIGYANYKPDENFVSVDWYTDVKNRSYYREGGTCLAVLSQNSERTPYEIFPDTAEGDFVWVGEATGCDIYLVNLDALPLEE